MKYLLVGEWWVDVSCQSEAFDQLAKIEDAVARIKDLDTEMNLTYIEDEIGTRHETDD